MQARRCRFGLVQAEANVSPSDGRSENHARRSRSTSGNFLLARFWTMPAH